MSLLERARNSKFERLENGDLSVENAVIIWSNFEGRPTTFNPAGGKRTFTLVLSEEWADILRAEGWNVKYREPKEEGDDPLIFTEIVVNMASKYPPRVAVYSQFRGRKNVAYLDERNIKQLDEIDIQSIDVVIHPYEHGRSASSRIKGYARVICAVQAQDSYFGGKYADWEEDRVEECEVY